MSENDSLAHLSSFSLLRVNYLLERLMRYLHSPRERLSQRQEKGVSTPEQLEASVAEIDDLMGTVEGLLEHARDFGDKVPKLQNAWLELYEARDKLDRVLKKYRWLLGKTSELPPADEDDPDNDRLTSALARTIGKKTIKDKALRELLRRQMNSLLFMLMMVREHAEKAALEIGRATDSEDCPSVFDLFPPPPDERLRSDARMLADCARCEIVGWLGRIAAGPTSPGQRFPYQKMWEELELVRMSVWDALTYMTALCYNDNSPRRFSAWCALHEANDALEWLLREADRLSQMEAWPRLAKTDAETAGGRADDACALPADLADTAVADTGDWMIHGLAFGVEPDAKPAGDGEDNVYALPADLVDAAMADSDDWMIEGPEFSNDLDIAPEPGPEPKPEPATDTASLLREISDELVEVFERCFGPLDEQPKPEGADGGGTSADVDGTTADVDGTTADGDGDGKNTLPEVFWDDSELPEFDDFDMDQDGELEDYGRDDPTDDPTDDPLEEVPFTVDLRRAANALDEFIRLIDEDMREE